MNKISELKVRINDSTKLGDLRKEAKEIKVDHDLAIKLWDSKELKLRLLSILIMDKKELSEHDIDNLINDMKIHPIDDQLQLMDWLFANQMTKSKSLINLIMGYKDSSNPLKRRTYWYYQGRLRWTGKTGFDNTGQLIDDIEKNLSNEDEIVQWAMNFVAGWIGVYEPEFREQAINIGIKTGLYKDDKVSPGCTPNYLPKFIEIEARKRNLI